MRGEWDLVFKSDESKGIGCAGSGIWCSDRMRARALGATAAGGTWGLPGFSKAPAAQSPRPYPKMVSPEAPSRGPGRDESMGIAQRSRTGPLQNSRNKPIFHFDRAPFSKTGELRPPDPSRSRVLSTSGPEKRGFAREPQKNSRLLIGQRRTRMLLRLN